MTTRQYKIELVPLDAIKPYEQNPRHNDQAVDAVARSFKEFGIRQPIVVDKDHVIICGHTRWKAAQLLGLKQYPIHIADNLHPEQVRAYRIADNQTGNIATWNMEILPIEIGRLQATGYDLTLLGFDPTQLQKILGPAAGETDPDAIPETPEIPITQPGETITLGPHRLLCGDARDIDQVEFFMGSNRAAFVFADPPYNVDYTGKTEDQLKIINDHMDDHDFQGFLFAAFTACRNAMEPGGIIYVSHSDTERLNFTAAFQRAGFKLAQNLIWVKNTAVMGRQDYNWRHEPILYGWKPGAAHYFCRDFTLTTLIDNAPDPETMKKADLVAFVKEIQAHLHETVIRIDRPTRSEKHPTMKPVDLVEKLIGNSSRHGDLVFDPFMGSGTTLIAAHRTGRRCMGIELDPRYCDVIIQRWEEYTGQTSERTPADN